jgi:hypothetical protein
MRRMPKRDYQFRENEILDFLRSGNGLCGVQLDAPVAAMLERLGKPHRHAGNEEFGGYYEYNGGIRFGYLGGQIIEMAVLLRYREGVHLPVSVPGTRTQSALTMVITEHTRMHTCLRLLQYAGLPWQAEPNADVDRLYVKVGDAGASIIFDLDDGHIHLLGAMSQQDVAPPRD